MCGYVYSCMVHVCVCSFMYGVPIHVCAHRHGGQRATLGVTHQVPSKILFDAGVSALS